MWTVPSVGIKLNSNPDSLQSFTFTLFSILLPFVGLWGLFYRNPLWLYFAHMCSKWASSRLDPRMQETCLLISHKQMFQWSFFESGALLLFYSFFMHTCTITFNLTGLPEGVSYFSDTGNIFCRKESSPAKCMKTTYLRQTNKRPLFLKGTFSMSAMVLRGKNVLRGL